ncbi:MAG: alpha/beta fold hydrolase [Promethearchaeota archaeon]
MDTKIITWFLIAIGLIIVFLFLWIIVSYKIWKKRIIKRLELESSIVETSLGSIEYLLIGQGPVVLMSHGGPGGYDQGYLLEDLTREGFSVLAPSRPGYLKTPLAVGRTYEEQADAFAALLDTLNIEKVAAIVGFSAGGPTALQFAIRHPSRCATLIMESGVSMRYEPPDKAEDTFWGRVFLSSGLQDLMSWILSVFTNRTPGAALKSMLKIESTFESKVISQKVDEVMKSPLHVQWFKALIRTTVPMSKRRAGLDNDIEKLRELPQYPLERITIPTLVMHSRYDNDAKWENAEFVKATIPNVELYEVDACGHLLWIGADAERVHKKRVEFLKKKRL